MCSASQKLLWKIVQYLCDAALRRSWNDASGLALHPVLSFGRAGFLFHVNNRAKPTFLKLMRRRNAMRRPVRHGLFSIVAALAFAASVAKAIAQSPDPDAIFERAHVGRAPLSQQLLL
jgi:hypothetical protein